MLLYAYNCKVKEATIININGLEIVHPVHGSTTFITDDEIGTIDYPFGRAFKHNQNLTNKLVDTFLEVKKKLKYRHRIFIFCQGNSGSVVSTIFASRLTAEGYEPRIIYVRKRGESRHGGLSFTPAADDLYIIVDDFISSGDTVNSIYKDIKGYLPSTHKHIDVLCVTGVVGRRDCDFPVTYIICKELA